MISTNNFDIPVPEQEKLRVLDIDAPRAKAELALEGRKGPIRASVEVLEVQAPWKAPHPLEHWQDAVLANLDALVGSFTGEPLEAQTSIHAFGNQWDPSPTAQHPARCYVFRLRVWEQVNFTIDSNLEVTISMMVSPDPKDRGLLIEDPSKPRVTRRIEDTDTEALVREVKRRGKR